MKNTVWLLACSLLSAFLAVVGYHFLLGTSETVIIRETPVQTRYANYSDDADDLFNSRYQENFRSAAPTNFTRAARRVTPSVVNIKTLENHTFDWWGPDGGSISSSSGSGVIISPDGYIVTNNHVIEEGNKYKVTLNNHEEYDAYVAGADPSSDLALLKIETERPLPFLIFGNSDSLLVGEWVLAVGNPFNLESTVTAGIVSAKGRDIDILEGEYSIESFIQTDAAVNPGNSGGALVNTNGELVGINTAIITRSGKYEGYSFAVPSNLAQKIVYDLRDYGEVQRGLLGIDIDKVTVKRARNLGLEKVEGVYIRRVTPGGAAELAGVEEDDVIIGIGKSKVKTMPALQEIIGRYRPGDQVKVTYIRKGQEFSTLVTLRSRSNSTEVVKAPDTDLLRRLGFELRDLSRSESLRLGIKGVYVMSIAAGSRIERTEMDPGYIVTSVNDKPVASVEALLAELEEIKISERVLLEGFYESFPGEYFYTFYIR